MDPLIVSIEKFLNKNKDELKEYLEKYLGSYELPVGESQTDAWMDCFSFLQDELENINSKFKEGYLIFEYMLPLERFRRPDVIILFKDKVVILEFKQKSIAENRDLEQVLGYREDIKNFHYVTSKLNLKTEGYIVATRRGEEPYTVRGVKVLTRKDFISEVFKEEDEVLGIKEVRAWIDSEYEPIPSIIEAANKLFHNEELPYIKNIADGEIEKTIAKVKSIISENEEVDKKKKIIFIAGVPGAGKTLVALKTVYDYNKENFGAIYLSGNGPLISVLQEQLSGINEGVGKAYIKGMIEFKKEYLEDNSKVPQNTLLAFDEAQRAWDKKKMRKNISEPDGLLKIADRIYDKYGYVTIVCFVGEGQSIYTGEEKGLALWEEALKKHNDYEIYVPDKYRDEFSFSEKLNLESELFLDTSIRTNFIDTSKWIEALLKLDKGLCKKYLGEMLERGLILRVSRNMREVKRFSEEFAKEHSNSNYGLLISSKAKLGEKSIKALTGDYFKGSYIKTEDAGNWYLRDCNKLGIAASEFVSQGLEMDLPIVIFGGDYYIKNGSWYLTKEMERDNKGKYEDYASIIENTYRVLLSRARKGMVLFVPNSEGFNETYTFLRELGIEAI